MNNRNIVLGVTGGIAAYKSADLIRRLRERGAEVRVVMTDAAKAFITPLTLQALSGNPVHDSLWDTEAEAAMGHIALARWAEAVIIAPASADFIAKLTHGLAGDLLSTLCLATEAPVMLAPAMNQQMWQDKATEENLAQLRLRGVKITGPGEGSQACGEVGLGRMSEPAEILEKVKQLFQTGLLEGEKILITAGPTREYFDPVRYLSNESSGKMGFALAEACVDAGASVTLIHGPVSCALPEKVAAISVRTAEEMFNTVMAHINHQDIFIATAAVSDYRPTEKALHKLPKTADTLTLSLTRNPDILSAVAELPQKPFILGFAAQTDNVIEKAREKLVKKHCDLVAANEVGLASQGFNSDNNALTALWQDGEKAFPLMSKKQLARQLILLLSEHYHAKNSAKNSG